MAASKEPEYPPFVLGKPRFNQETYYGRLRHFMEVVDPATLLTSERKLRESIKLLDDFKKGTLPEGTTDKQLWQAQKIKQAIIHPDTGEKIFPPFRMSGYVPFGSITVIGLLLPNQTIKQIIFWQWLNQSHNAAVNYSNRNATKPTPTTRFLAGYVGAVSSAVSIAVGLSMFLRKASAFPQSTRALIERFVPYPAVACANIFNVVLMRNNELKEGIEVFDKSGNVLGTSKVAAKKAIGETVLTRIFLPAPILVIPPIIMAKLEKTKFLRSRPAMVMPVQAVVATICFAVSLPLAISLFPQTSKISKSKLEPELAAVATSNELYYNKGL